MNRVPLERVREALVIRTDHIGDLVLSTPFLHALRRQIPQARITALLSPYTREVLEGSPLVDEVLVYDPHDKEAGHRTMHALRQRGVDLAVSLAPRSRAYRLAWRSGATWRVGYVYSTRPLARVASQAWLTHRMIMHVEEDLKAGRPVAHEVDQLGLLAREMGLEYGDPELELTVPEEHRQFGRSLVAGWGPHVAGLHLARGWVTGGWRLRNLIRLVEGLLWSTDGGGVLITYGPGEESLATRLAEGLAACGLLGPGLRLDHGGDGDPPREPRPIRLAGGLTFKQWAGALAACHCVVSTDTGAVHVASALGRPVVAVYEAATHRLCCQQWAPWKVPHRTVVKGHPVETMSAVLQGVEELLIGS